MEVSVSMERTIKAHNERCWDVSWSPDGKLLSTAGGDKCAKIWADFEQMSVLSETRTVRRAKFAPDGRKVATCSFNGKEHIQYVARLGAIQYKHHNVYYNSTNTRTIGANLRAGKWRL